MDVDEAENQAPAPVVTDDETVVAELGSVLEQIEQEPNNIFLLRRQVDLMLQVGMVSEACDAASSASKLFFLGEALWHRILDANLASLTTPVNLDTVAQVLEAFAAAEDEYLSPVIFQLHATFLVGLTSTGDITGDDEVREYLDADTMRTMLRNIAERCNGLLNEIQAWQTWIDWEVSLLHDLSGSDKKEQIRHIGDLYLARLQTPHTTASETSSAYSSFCTKYFTDDYEDRLVQATKASQDAKWKLDREKRHGRTRTDFEEQLVSTTDVGQQAQLLLQYVDWETDPAAKRNKKAKGPQQDVGLCRGVFERLLLVYGNAAAAAEDASFAAAHVPEMAQQMRDTASAYKAAEATIWCRYFDWASENLKPNEDENPVTDVAGRAVRACPESGEVWNRQLTAMEAANDIPGIEKSVEKAQGLIVSNKHKQSVASLVELFVTHASILHRRYRELPANDEHPVFLNLVAASDSMLKAYPEGDPSLRLEKFSISWAEVAAVELIMDLIALLSTPVRSRDASYQWTILSADTQARYGDVDGARERYNKAIQGPDLDWPEAVFEAFTTFENVHGSLETIQAARKHIGTAQKKLNRRREREAQAQQAQQAAYAHPQAEAAAPVAAEPATAPAEPAVEPMVVDSVAPAVASTEAAPPTSAQEKSAVAEKPSAAVAPGTTASAGDKADGEVEIKRDRENSTVLVTGLSPDTTVARVKAFFEESGEVRECSMTEEPGAAMVEFMSAETVPVALGRDGKKLDGRAVRVSMLWRCTLWVTNFPRSADNDSLKQLFGQYGKILSIRWPSRKYVDSRRFCYVTMESPAAAQEALVLHKFQPAGESFPMSVLISDPAKRTKRTDYSNCTLFIGGLHPKSTEGEVRHLLERYGTIVSVKVPWDKAKNQAKGIAFVEMQNKAQADAALEANGASHRGRHLKVEISDPQHAEKNRGKISNAQQATDRRERTVYLFDIPPGSQEGLLQQELEKHFPVRRVELFENKGQARVELESANDAGALLLRSDKLEFNGATLRIQDHSESKTAPAKPAAAMAASTSKPEASSSLSFAPRPRKTNKAMGQAYRPPRAAAATAAAKPSGGSGQDQFRAFMNTTNEARKKADEEAKAKASADRAKREAEWQAREADRKRALEDGEEGSEAKRPKRGDKGDE
ncbi:uncharacterized protein CcaverHIS019_0104410 [Cutaneotrichosporon cavernicola]|uniref:U4/U6 snRNA-associated-splicing factor PRP24 n=1 Tax=Cutaneotrichosporon cavernicola TaxID=279322 RepID=A0AA48IHW9_9TREE|nr:uncharacterized protein CcaverHIS019_0104410 [Cutaneotrichosporon cavernicola]BEI87723.1 hypothetical protein CcaverHIS019_0104410 [Cutaneotrichosporon cavernicola]BEI95494.1 hypothetical protein CcaverHIS631_0104430 [Cutaneotrichosporon cavernicola]BEJ03268.1 hypothetical protein CcaverHIS641_0104430 [Cutaneotrichosporon cavernicola]